MTEAQILYDRLDRLVHSILSAPNTDEPGHAHSPVGAALRQLHLFKHLKSEHCICANEFRYPPL